MRIVRHSLLAVLLLLAPTVPLWAQEVFGTTLRTRDAGGSQTDRIRIQTDVNVARVTVTNSYLDLDGIAEPSAPTGGTIYFDGTSNLLRYYDGGAWRDLRQYTGGTGISVSGGTISLSTPVTVSLGGTGATTLTGMVTGNGTSAFTAVAATAASQYLRRNSTNTAYEFGTFQASDIPDLSATYVTLTTAQTISGTKTFSAAPSYTAGTPFAVSSTGWVQNLNADLVDGMHAMDFMPNTADNWVDVTGDTMTGGLAMSGNAVTNVAVEGLTADPVAPQPEGRVIWRSDADQLKVWDSSGGTWVTIGGSNAGILSLNGLTAASQTFANDTNVTISSAGSAHTLGWSGTLPIARGGTNAGSIGIAGSLPYSTGAAYAFGAAGSSGQVLQSGGAGAPMWGAVDLASSVQVSGLLGPANGGTGVNTSFSTGVPNVSAGSWSIADPLPIARGGTNASSIGAAGSIAYSTGSAYTFNAAGSAGQVFKSGGAGAPTWGAVNLASATEVTGVLPVSNGGTGLFSLSGANRLLVSTGASSLTPLDPGAVGQVLTIDAGGNVVWATAGGAPASAAYVTVGNDATLTGERALTGGTGISISDGGANGSIAVDLANTTVFPGTYTYATVTVDAQGRITSASNGTAPVTSVSASSPLSSSGGTAPNISLTGVVAAANGGTGTDTSFAGTGSVLYASGAGSWSVLGAGSGGQVLTMSGGVPTWQNPSGGLTGGGTATQVAFWTGSTSLGGTSNLYWDNTNSRLGIGTSSPTESLQVWTGNIKVGNTGFGTMNKIYFGDGAYVWVGEDGADDRLGLRGTSFFINIGGSVGAANQALVSNGTTSSWQNVVNSVASGTGISVSAGTGNVTITNTGVTSLSAGSGISLSGSTGAVTVTNAGVLGSGTAGFVPRWTAGNTIGNGVMRDDGTNVGVGASALAGYRLNVSGYTYFDVGSQDFIANYDAVEGGDPTLRSTTDAWGLLGTSSFNLWRVRAYNFTTASDRTLKRDIQPANGAILDRINSDLDRVSPYLFRYAVESPREGEAARYRPHLRLGVMLDELPDYVQDNTFTGVDLYSLASLGIAGVKQNRERLAALEQGTPSADFGVATITGEDVRVSYSQVFAQRIGPDAEVVVCVTPRSGGSPLWVAERDATGFRVARSPGDAPVEFDWVALTRGAGFSSSGEGPVPAELEAQLRVPEDVRQGLRTRALQERTESSPTPAGPGSPD